MSGLDEGRDDDGEITAPAAGPRRTNTTRVALGLVGLVVGLLLLNFGLNVLSQPPDAPSTSVPSSVRPAGPPRTTGTAGTAGSVGTTGSAGSAAPTDPSTGSTVATTTTPAAPAGAPS